MKNLTVKLISKSATALLLALALLVRHDPAYAGGVSLVHRPPQGEEMAAPGVPMTLNVQLDGSRNSQLKMRLVLVRDGRLMDVMVNDLAFDEDDHLVYSTQINAPLVEMSYQFILFGKNEVVAVSPHYTVSRGCMPDISNIDTKLSPDLDLNQQLQTMVKQAAGLEAEVQNYESVLKLLDELKSITDK